MYFYLLTLNSFYDDPKTEQKLPVVKIGTTKYPEGRRRQYKTGSPIDPSFIKLFHLTDKSQFPLENDLYRLDKIKWIEFLEAEGLEEELHCKLGGGTEWFWQREGIDYPKLMKKFLKQNEIIYEIVESTPKKSGNKKNLREEDEIREQISDLELLREKFQEIVLGGKKFRLPQIRLWDKFINLSRGDKVIGIVEWMMGVGKTNGGLEMMTIANYNERNGIRGLVVCHRNDILEEFANACEKLNEFGIEVYRHFGKYKFNFEQNGPFVLFTTHSSITNEEFLEKLPEMNFFLYDEVHRASGELGNQNLKKYLDQWDTKYILGLSATPLTGVPEQAERLKNIYGDPLKIIDECKYLDAIKLGIIVPLKIHLIERSAGVKQKDVADFFKEDINEYLNLFNPVRDKVICFVPSSRGELNDVKKVFEKNYSEILDCYHDSAQFQMAKSEKLDCLFACRTHLEGSNLKDLTGSIFFGGDSISLYIIFQCFGRAVRIFYIGKEAHCLLFYTGGFSGCRQIINDLGELIGISSKSSSGQKEIVSTMFSSVKLLDKRVLDAEKFLMELQDPVTLFESLRSKNKMKNLHSEKGYFEKMKDEPDFIPNPEEFFGILWKNWAYFLGFPEKINVTLTEIFELCRKNSIDTMKKLHDNEGKLIPKNVTLYYANIEEEFTKRFVTELD